MLRRRVQRIGGPRHPSSPPGRVRFGSAMAGLAFLLSICWASETVGSQDPDQQLREWAETRQTEAIRKLLAESQTLDIDSPGEAGWTALMYAAKAGNDDIVQILLEADAKVNLENDAKETALHIAAMHGRTEAVRLLLKAGADIGVRDAERRTPLYRAIENRHADVIELLQERARAMADEGRPVQEGDQEEMVPPKIVESTLASYTDSALRKKIEGTVVLMVLVRRDGTIGGASVSKGLEESLDEIALETVRKWKFEPATRGGQPVDALLEINIDFTLPSKR